MWRGDRREGRVWGRRFSCGLLSGGEHTHTHTGSVTCRAHTHACVYKLSVTCTNTDTQGTHTQFPDNTQLSLMQELQPGQNTSCPASATRAQVCLVLQLVAVGVGWVMGWFGSTSHHADSCMHTQTCHLRGHGVMLESEVKAMQVRGFQLSQPQMRLNSRFGISSSTQSEAVRQPGRWEAVRQSGR